MFAERAYQTATLNQPELRSLAVPYIEVVNIRYLYTMEDATLAEIGKKPVPYVLVRKGEPKFARQITSSMISLSIKCLFLWRSLGRKVNLF